MKCRASIAALRILAIAAIVTGFAACNNTESDGTGTAAVDLNDAEVIFALDHHINIGLLSSAPAHVEQVLSERYGTSTKGLVFSKKMRVRETFLELGDELFLLGQVSFGANGLEFSSGGPRLLVSDRNLRAVVARETRVFAAWLIAAVIVVGLSGLLAWTMLA